jgi:hypothetical protein
MCSQESNEVTKSRIWFTALEPLREYVEITIADIRVTLVDIMIFEIVSECITMHPESIGKGLKGDFSVLGDSICEPNRLNDLPRPTTTSGPLHTDWNGPFNP